MLMLLLRKYRSAGQQFESDNAANQKYSEDSNRFPGQDVPLIDTSISRIFLFSRIFHLPAATFQRGPARLTVFICIAVHLTAHLADKSRRLRRSGPLSFTLKWKLNRFAARGAERVLPSNGTLTP
jgi:hypothetical protein